MVKKIDLAGQWNFTLDAAKEGISKEFYKSLPLDTISLPGTTSLAKKGTPSDVRETGFLTDPYLFEGYAWYSKEISLDNEDLDKTIFLNLERTRLTKVWIDNEFAGEADSLATPHKYNLSGLVKNKDFRLTVLVSNTDYPTKGGHLTSPDTQTNWNGIIGDISLSIYDSIYIQDIKTYPDIDKKSVKIKVTVINNTGNNTTLMVNTVASPCDINGYTGKSADRHLENIPSPAGTSVYEYEYPLGDNAILWSEYTPVIYHLVLTIEGTAEKAETTFGLRKFSAENMDFLINGTKTFLRGKHDGLIFPLTGAFPTDLDEWLRIMGIAKSYGINHYRYHTCCPPDAAFTAADLLGIYLEPQLPFWGTLTAPGDEGHNEEEQQYLVNEGFRMLDTYGNHASYCMMSLGNELWGSKERMAEIITAYKNTDNRHLYTQGSNNFQHTPVILPEDDFFVGVRLSKNRLIRGSYGMCDAPLGHIQWDEPSTDHNYNDAIHPSDTGNSLAGSEEEIEIQYGTGVKKVKAADSSSVLIPEIPVVTHEIGQFTVYPDFREIEKYTGVLKARNFEVFKERLEEKGMLAQAYDFFYASGKLAVQCYKEELEAAARSSLVAGYQILDLQDFTGQGTALVGILDAFMDSKGLVTPEEWAGYCSDAILLAEFGKYIYTAGEKFNIKLAMRYYNPESLDGKILETELSCKDNETGMVNIIGTIETEIPEGIKGLAELGNISFDLPAVTKPEIYTLRLSVPGTNIHNSYEVYCYPANENTETLGITGSTGRINDTGTNKFYITNNFQEACNMLDKGLRVLFLPAETKESIEGFYCTDFWCYPMFRDICEWMKKPVAVGTMGLLIQNRHKALAQFPSHKYATPQWYKIVSHASCAILEDVTEQGYTPIVQMIDNFERNHKLGILFEGKAGNGKLLICTSRLSEISSYPEIKQFIKSITDYVASDSFNPGTELDLDKLKKLF